MPDPNAARRFALIAAAVTSGVIVAMMVEIMLARRGMELAGAWQQLIGTGTQLQAALAWWAITGGAFAASFTIAAVVSRFDWLYFRSLRWLAAAALAFALATVADSVPLTAPEVAGHHALATLAALVAAMTMAWFGAYFAMRR
jgi:hypothetical protein